MKKTQITATSDTGINATRNIKEVRHSFDNLEPIFLRNDPYNKQGMCISGIVHQWAGDINIGISNDDDNIQYDLVDHPDLPITVTAANRAAMRTINLTNIQAKYIVVEFTGTPVDANSYFCLFSGD